MYKLVFENINESSLDSIRIEDIIDNNTIEHILMDSYNTELFMWQYAHENRFNPEELDDNIWPETNEEKLWVKDKIEELCYETINMFEWEVINGQYISIWREMLVSEDWLTHLLTSGKRLGIYWSWDKNAAEPHGGYNQESKDLNVVIESNINVSHVNWIDTIRLNMDPASKDEREIRLFKNTPLKIEKLWINEEEIDENLFKNKIFKA